MSRFDPPSLRDLLPEEEDAVSFAVRLPGYPDTFKEAVARVLDGELESFAEDWPDSDAEKARARLGLSAIGSARLNRPLTDGLKGQFAGDFDLAFEDLKQYWVSPSERKPLASATFPAVMQSEGWRLVWNVYTALKPGTSGRVAYALQCPGSGKGCALVNNLPDPATRAGFDRAVSAAQALARSIRRDRGVTDPDQLPDLLVWASPLGEAPVFSDGAQRYSQFAVARLWGGPSGTLALAAALLSAYLEEPIDAHHSLYTGNLENKDGTWWVSPVGSKDYKDRLAEVLGEEVKFYGAFEEATERDNPVGMRLTDVWKEAVSELTPLIKAVAKLAEHWDGLPGTFRRNTDFERSTIRFLRAYWVVRSMLVDQGSDQVGPGDVINTFATYSIEDDEQRVERVSEETARSDFEELATEVSSRKYSTSNRHDDKRAPILVTAGAGMGKTFASRRLAVETCRKWIHAVRTGAQPGLLPIWLSLEQINEFSPEGLLDAVLSIPGLTDLEIAVFKRLWCRSGLLLLLDARDQADKAENRLAALCNSLANRCDLSVVITTRPIRRDKLWAEFGGWRHGCVEYRLQEFGPRELRLFLERRLSTWPALAEAIRSFAATDRGRRARLNIPVIAEFISELSVEDSDFVAQLRTGLSSYRLYERLIAHRLSKALIELKQEATPDKVRQLMLTLGYSASILFDERPGQNLFTEAELAELRAESHRLFAQDFGRDSLPPETVGKILVKSGLLESFLDGGGQSNFVHRTVLEFLRGWYLATQYSQTRRNRWDWTNERFPWSLRMLFERKGWDEQWREALLFFAQWLDETTNSGPAFAEFLRIVEMEDGDDLLNHRLDLAVRCLRQCWRLYEKGEVALVSESIQEWSKGCLRRSDHLFPNLIPSLPALWHYRDGKLTGPVELIVNPQGYDLQCGSTALITYLIESLSSKASFSREYLESLGAWSIWGSSLHLKQLLGLMELRSDGDGHGQDGVDSRCWVLATVLRDWHSHASINDLRFLLKVIRDDQLEWATRWALSQTLAAWTTPATRECVQLVLRWISEATDQDTRLCLAKVLSGWSVVADVAVLDIVLSMIKSDSSLYVRRTLAEGLVNWSSLAVRGHFLTLIECMKVDPDWGTRLSLAEGLRGWDVHASSGVVCDIVKQCISENNEYVRDQMILRVREWVLSLEHSERVSIALFISQAGAQDGKKMRKLLEVVDSGEESEVVNTVSDDVWKPISWERVTSVDELAEYQRWRHLSTYDITQVIDKVAKQVDHVVLGAIKMAALQYYDQYVDEQRSERVVLRRGEEVPDGARKIREVSLHDATYETLNTLLSGSAQGGNAIGDLRETLSQPNEMVYVEYWVKRSEEELAKLPRVMQERSRLCRLYLSVAAGLQSGPRGACRFFNDRLSLVADLARLD